jgi:hypothetical protein
MRGLLAGCHLGAAVPGAWGLFALSDFNTAPNLRVAGAGIGPGVLVQVPLGDARLRATAIVAATAMGGAGTTAETDYYDPTSGMPPRDSLYSMGPGAQGVADVELALGEWVSIRAIGRTWWVAAITPRHGLDRVNLASAGVFARLPARMFAGAESSFAQRFSAAGRDPYQSGWTARAIWGMRLGTEPRP